MVWHHLQVLLKSILLFSVGCGTVELGDHFVSPDPIIDEDFFYCRIQPDILNVHRCASGGPGEEGSCHSARSALRLSIDAESVSALCEDDRLLEDPPDSWKSNLENIRFTIRNDPLSSPFYRRPTGLDSHPRVLFNEGSDEADLIITWIVAGGG